MALKSAKIFRKCLVYHFYPNYLWFSVRKMVLVPFESSNSKLSNGTKTIFLVLGDQKIRQKYEKLTSHRISIVSFDRQGLEKWFWYYSKARILSYPMVPKPFFQLLIIKSQTKNEKFRLFCEIAQFGAFQSHRHSNNLEKILEYIAESRESKNFQVHF